MSFQNPKEKVIIYHEVYHSKKGPQLIRVKEGQESETYVDRYYSKDRVRTISGDVWNVERINGILHTTPTI